MRYLLGVFLFVCSALSYAGLIGSQVLNGCNNQNLTLDNVQVATGGTNLLPHSYNASTCVMYTGNDDGGLSSPSTNIGQQNDGLLNGEGGFNVFDLIGAGDLQALDVDGLVNDPGWIHLAHLSDNVNATPSYSNVGPAPLGDGNSINIDNLLSMSFQCGSGNANDCTQGTWTLSVDGLGVISTVQSLLGRPATFDHLAISIKAGNGRSGAGFVVYDFDFKSIFADANNPALNFLTPYTFSGSFNTLDLSSHGVSHINVWARDPAAPVNVPEPNTLLLLSLALLLVTRIKLTVK